MGTHEASVEVRETNPGVGRGLFAAGPIKKGEFIAEYTGEKIPTALADALPSRYLFELDEEWTINGESEKNTAGYINHACIPNAEAEIDGHRIFVYAIHDIEKGEEITIDYGEEYFDEFIRPAGCKCFACAPLP